MIKKKTLLTALATLGLAFTAVSAQAADLSSFVKGDLLLGFQATAGTGSGTVVYVNLGLATDFLSGNFASINGVNLNSVLTSTYGSGWATNTGTTLYWGAVALANNISGTAGTSSGGVQVTDPSQTLYVSRARTAGGTDGSANSTAWSLPSGTVRNNTANLVNTMQADSVLGQGGFTAPVQNGTNTSAGVADAGTTSVNWAHYNVGGTGASFTNFAAPGIQQSFGSNQTVGGQTVVGALDVYRILGTAAGNVVGSNTLGAGQYTSTLTLDASGNVGAVPEPSTYALFGLAAVGLIAFRHRFQKA